MTDYADTQACNNQVNKHELITPNSIYVTVKNLYIRLQYKFSNFHAGERL